MSVTVQRPAPFTAHELEARRPVWSALSDLYLDTDTRVGLPRVAQVLAESGLEPALLECIWREELTPALAFNLTLVAGEWAYFDQAWLEQGLLRRRRLMRRWPWLQRLSRWRPNEMEPYFQTVLALRAGLLALQEGQRELLVQAWDALAHAYFWPETPALARVPDIPDLSAVWAALEPHLRPLLTAKESADLSRTHVLTLIGAQP